MCVSFHLAKEAITIVSVMNAHARAKLAYVVVRRYARLTLVHQTREDRVRWTLQIQLGGVAHSRVRAGYYLYQPKITLFSVLNRSSVQWRKRATLRGL